MAVRNDFSAGEVLAAADLNDTFASKLPYSYGTATPTTTDSGFLWYDSNSTPPVPKYWNGSSFATLAPAPGLELIDGDSWTAVSSVSIDNLFTASYDNYRIIINATSSVGAQLLRSRLRASGSDFTSSNYFFAGPGHDTGNAASSFAAGSQSNWALTYLDSNHTNITTIDFFRPTTSERKFAVSTSVGMNAGDDQYVGRLTGLAINTTATADGLTIYVDSGTFTGTVRSYGYKN